MTTRLSKPDPESKSDGPFCHIKAYHERQSQEQPEGGLAPSRGLLSEFCLIAHPCSGPGRKALLPLARASPGGGGGGGQEAGCCCKSHASSMRTVLVGLQVLPQQW